MIDELPTKALSQPLHRCLGCGGSCRGVRIRLLDGEADRIRTLAPELGIADPIEGGVLRTEAGACVFLDGTDRCRLHERFGPQSKPLICQQYPFVSTRADAEIRVGVDPGCYTSWRTWRDGPALSASRAVTTSAALDPSQGQAERALLALARSSQATVPSLLSALCPGQPGADGLPAGLGGRIAGRLRAMDLDELLGRPESGASLRGALTPVVGRIQALDPDLPPDLPAVPEINAFSVDILRRMIFLRLQPQLPVPAVALLTLIGSVACAWTSTELPVFGPALAAWTRGLRAPPFWRALIPDEAALHHLATGG